MDSEDIPTDWVDPDDAPELTDEWFDKAEIRIGEHIVRRGRPRICGGALPGQWIPACAHRR